MFRSARWTSLRDRAAALFVEISENQLGSEDLGDGTDL